MAIFTITTQQNITQLISKAGDDTYNINGGELIIDCDSRVGPNQSSSSILGPINVSTTLGGKLTIASTSVRLIPFSVGSGAVPTSGTILTQGANTAELLCVMQYKTGGAVYSNMPSTGWLKVRNLTGSFTAGTINGISAVATGADEPGWIILAGSDTRIFTIPRMGEMSVQGNWFSVGTTIGSRGQAVQLPFFAQEGLIYYPGVEIEKYPGSGEYEFWANVGAKYTSTSISTDSRSRFVNINTTGVLNIGTGLDGLPAGDLPIAGCNIRVPGIILQTASSSNKAVNNEPSSSIGNRYEAQFSAAGVLNHNISTGSWYWNLIQAYSLNITDLHTCDQFVLGECATAPNLDQIHVGLSTRSSPLAIYSFVLQQCYNGGTIGTISAVRAESSNNNAYCVTLTNLYNNWIIGKVRGVYASDVTAISGPVFVNMCDDLVIDCAEVVGKRLLAFSSNRVKIKKIVYADNVKSTTQTSLGSHVFETTTQSRDCIIENIVNWPDVANVHPYSGLIYSSGSSGIRVRNIGSPSSPYNCGTINQTGYLYSDGGNNSDNRLQRIWVKGIRLNLSGGTNTSSKQLLENCYNEDASKTIGPQQLNAVTRGNRQNAGGVPSSYVGVYGVHFWDSFTSDTTCRMSIVFTEKTGFTTSAYNIESGNPKFTAQGALYMQSGDSITWTWNYSIRGWTGLSSFAKQGTKTTNFLYEYDLDKGNGFSGIFKVLTDANLQSETGISPEGFKPRFRITCTVSDVTNLLTSFRVDGTTTLALQNVALYPLDTAYLKLTNVLPGSMIAVFDGIPGNEATPITYGVCNDTTATLSYPFDDAATNYTVRIRKAGYDVIELLYTNSLNTTIPIAQQENKDGFGVPILNRGNATTSSLIYFDPKPLRIDIGNGRVNAEDLYDTVSAWQASETGIKYPEAIRFDGVDVLVLNGWRFRRKEASYTNAGLDALPVVDGFPGLSPDDESNGSVDFKARSVRTFDSDKGEIISNATIAEAVQAKLAEQFALVEKRACNPLFDAVNENLAYWVITRNGSELVGVTTDNPMGKPLDNVSVHEMYGPIPDLNFYDWDYENDVFTCRIHTKTLFLSKFTIDEMIAIRSSTDMIVKTFIDRVDASHYVNTKDKMNIDSINYLVQVGLLLPERASEVIGN